VRVSICIGNCGSRIPPRTLVLAWHRDRYRSQAAEAFVDLARELANP